MLPRASFTIDTLDKLRATFPQHGFRLIMGADNLLAIDKWKEPERLLKQYRLLIYPRPGYSLEAQPQTKGLQVVDAPLLDLRSEEHTSELQSRPHLVCRLLLEKKKEEHANNVSKATFTT